MLSLPAAEMAASFTMPSLFSDDIDDLIDPQLLALLDRPAGTTETSTAQADISQSSALAGSKHQTLLRGSAHRHSNSTVTASLPTASYDNRLDAAPASPPSAAAAAARERCEFVPASYDNLPFPLPAHVRLPCTAWSLLRQPPTVLSFGCGWLDALLDGGLRPGITELVGEAGAAKSQVCFQLLLQVQLGLPPPLPAPRRPLYDYGLGGCGFYLVTEGRPPMTRLQQLQEAMQRRFAHMAGYDFLANVFMQEVHSVEQLLSIVEQLCADHSRVREQRLRLLIIDSVAGLFRADGEAGVANSTARAEAQFRLSSALRRLASEQRMVVVACNQVTDRFLPAEPVLRSSETYRDHYTIVSSGRQVLPALGLSWANCVDVRLAVSRRGGGRGGGGPGGGGGGLVLDGGDVQREMQLIFAPHLPRQSMAFVVDADGVRGKENTLRLLEGADEGEDWQRAMGVEPQRQQHSKQPPASNLAGRTPLTPIAVNAATPPPATRAMPSQTVRYK